MIALTYQDRRGAEMALEASERAYRTTITAYPDAPKHPRVIEGRLLYGRALARAGRLADGVRQLALAVDDAAEVFGPASRMVGFFSVHLATFQLETGEIGKALANSRKSFDIVSEHSRPESYRYAAVLQSRGAALLGARRTAEALPDLTRAVETVRRELAPEHDVTRAFAADQALALARLGRYDEAEQVIQEAAPRNPQTKDRLTARLHYVLGVVKRLRGEYTDALGLQRQSLASMQDRTTFELTRMNVLTEMGLNLQELARPVEASAFLEQALSFSRHAQTRPNPDRADVLVGLGRARMTTGRLTEALSLLQEADRFWRDFDGGNRSAGEAAFWLGRCEASLHRGADAHRRSTMPSASSRGLRSTPTHSSYGSPGAGDTDRLQGGMGRAHRARRVPADQRMRFLGLVRSQLEQARNGHLGGARIRNVVAPQCHEGAV